MFGFLGGFSHNFSDEIALSDAETKDSESESDDDDTALTMSACGTSEPVHAVADSTNTAQLQDTVDCGKLPLAWFLWIKCLLQILKLNQIV